LDLGCGTGAMLVRISAIAQAFGTDVSEVSLQYCRSRGQRRLTFADGTHLPFADDVFEGVISLDVIEHIEDDASVFAELYRVCTKQAVVIITVPALQWLWSSRDERLGHKRRYHRAKLVARAQEAGFVVEKCSYYCLTLFPMFAAAVFLQRLVRRRAQLQQDVPRLPRWMNACLLQVLLAEQWLMDFMNYPVGASVFCVLRKRSEDTMART
jgi:SAM-dependent methyltransferase